VLTCSAKPRQIRTVYIDLVDQWYVVSIIWSCEIVVQQMTERTDWDLLPTTKEIGENCKQMLSQWADGCSDREIAESMGYKTADVVKTSRLRCLEKLRQLYKPT
jgi:hypothetical protein